MSRADLGSWDKAHKDFHWPKERPIAVHFCLNCQLDVSQYYYMLTEHVICIYFRDGQHMERISAVVVVGIGCVPVMWEFALGVYCKLRGQPLIVVIIIHIKFSCPLVALCSWCPSGGGDRDFHTSEVGLKQMDVIWL